MVLVVDGRARRDEEVLHPGGLEDDALRQHGVRGDDAVEQAVGDHAVLARAEDHELAEADVRLQLRDHVGLDLHPPRGQVEVALVGDEGVVLAREGRVAVDEDREDLLELLDEGVEARLEGDLVLGGALGGGPQVDDAGHGGLTFVLMSKSSRSFGQIGCDESRKLRDTYIIALMYIKVNVPSTKIPAAPKGKPVVPYCLSDHSWRLARDRLGLTRGPRTSRLQLVDERRVEVASVAHRDLLEGGLDADEPERDLRVEHAEAVAVVHLAACAEECDDHVASRIDELRLVAADLDRLDEGEPVADEGLDDRLDELGALASGHGLHHDAALVAGNGLDVSTQVRVELEGQVVELRQIRPGAGPARHVVEVLQEELDGVGVGREAEALGLLDEVDARTSDVVGAIRLLAEQDVDPVADAVDDGTEHGITLPYLLLG